MTDATAARREILVVDDDADTAMTFASLLGDLGHAAEYVTSPEMAVDIARRVRPWLIFLDIGMPHVNGWELAQALRRELGREGVRIVAVTGRADPDDHKRSREAGFDAHVHKPIDMPLLQSILAQVG